MRRDVLEKLELVEAKFQSDFPQHAKSILKRRAQHQKETAAALELTSVFPIEADLEQETLDYGKSEQAQSTQIESSDPLQTELQTEQDSESLIKLD